MNYSPRCTCFSRINRLAAALLAAAALAGSGCSSSDDGGGGGGGGTPPGVVVLTINNSTTFVDYFWDPVPGVVDGTPDATLTLTVGTRYEVNNTVAGNHPLELLTMGSGPSTDIVLASQFGGGSWEGDAGVDWDEVSNNVVRFTVTAAFAAELSCYRCLPHRFDIRGIINYSP